MPLRVLIVEDFEKDAELMRRELTRDGFTLESCRVDTLAGMRTALEESCWNVILADYAIPGFGAPEALALKMQVDPDLPFILVSERIGEEVAVGMMRAGASDYISKQSLRRLAPAVRRELREAENRRARRQAERSVNHLAAIVQSSSDAIFSVNPEGIVTSWNPGAERLFGWSAPEAVGQPISFIIPPERLHELSAMRTLVLEGKEIPSFDTVRLHKAGLPIDVAVALSPIWDINGQLVGISCVIRDIREKKRAEEILRQSELKYGILAEAIPQLVWVIGADGIPQHFNSRWLQYIGLSVEESSNGDWDRIIHPDDVPLSYSRWMEAMRSGEPYEVEYRLRRHDGVYRWFLVRGVPMRDSAGQIVRWVGTCTDIEEQKRAADALRLSEERYRTLFECAPDGIVIADSNSYYLDANPSICQMLGYTRNELIGRHASDIVSAMETQYIEPALNVIKARSNYHREWQFRRKDGSLFPGEVIATMMPDGNLIGMIRDMTDRKKAEESLLLLGRAIQTVTQGIIITDATQPNHPILYASPGFERLTGYSQTEILGRSFHFLQGKDTSPEAMRQVREAILEERSCAVTLLNYKKDGSSFWNELYISPVRDAAGRLTHFVKVQTDVTERRLLEEQYRQAQKMEAIGQLAGGIAHDFNNLLTVILGYGYILLRELEPADSKHTIVEQIQQAGEMAASLTRQLLVFSRKQVVELRELDLNALVASAEKMLRRLIGEDIRLETSLRLSRGRVKADAGQLEQVLLNLALNARDAMPRGGQLTIETDAVELDEGYASLHAKILPGPYARLTVTDTGVGMPPEVVARIYEPFFTTKPTGKGTGLGLAVVHGIIRQAGGSIEVYSEEGIGTTFKVYLPRFAAPARASHLRAERGKLSQGSETILLAEDEPAVRALTSRLLRNCGYTVLEAGNGSEGLHIAETHPGPIHLLLTDVVMPAMGGRQLAERATALRPETKVLYMSGYTDDAVVRHGILLEQMQFIQKPFRPIDLASKLRAMLDG